MVTAAVAQGVTAATPPSRQSLEIYSRLALTDAQATYDQAIGRFPCEDHPSLRLATRSGVLGPLQAIQVNGGGGSGRQTLTSSGVDVRVGYTPTRRQANSRRTSS
jgi:hypothetical protein